MYEKWKRTHFDFSLPLFYMLNLWKWSEKKLKQHLIYIKYVSDLFPSACSEWRRNIGGYLWGFESDYELIHLFTQTWTSQRAAPKEKPNNKSEYSKSCVIKNIRNKFDWKVFFSSFDEPPPAATCKKSRVDFGFFFTYFLRLGIISYCEETFKTYKKVERKVLQHKKEKTTESKTCKWKRWKFQNTFV